MNPKIGQKIHVIPTGNNVSRHRIPELFEAEVVSVGRKYFKAKPNKESWFTIEFHLDSWTEKSDIISGYKAYPSEQEYWDETEKSELYIWIRRDGDSLLSKLPLEKLRAIRDILTG